MTSASGRTRLRADAVQKRADILAAARTVFVERGADVPMDDIAKRARVGSATLYRHFPDRSVLIREVVREVLGQMTGAAQAAQAEEGSAFAALVRYMHQALEIGVAAVMPVLAGAVEMDPDLEDVRDRGVVALESMIRQAKAEHALREDAAFADIGVMLIRLSRPLPGGIRSETSMALAHRHLDIYIDGLRAQPRPSHSLPGPALSRAELPGQTGRDPMGPID